MKVIYLDLVFLLNAGMDGLLLFLSAKAWGRPVRWQRLLLAALSGGLWACLVTVNRQRHVVPDWWAVVLTWTLISAWMVWLVFRPKGIQWAKYLVTLYGMTFLVGGGLDALYYQGGQMAAWVLVAGGAMLAAGIVLTIRYLLPCFREPDVRPVSLEFRGKTLQLNGLYDTGNRLQDPVFGTPVHVLELTAAREIFTEKEQQYLEQFGQVGEPPDSLPPIFYIPYQSVGQPDGMMPALFMDELQIGGEQPCRLERPLVGFSFHALNQSRQYQMILHPVPAAGPFKKNWRTEEYDFKSIHARAISVENDADSAQPGISSSGRGPLYRGE